MAKQYDISNDQWVAWDTEVLNAVRYDVYQSRNDLPVVIFRLMDAPPGADNEDTGIGLEETERYYIYVPERKIFMEMVYKTFSDANAFIMRHYGPNTKENFYIHCTVGSACSKHDPLYKGAYKWDHPSFKSFEEYTDYAYSVGQWFRG